MMSLNSPIKTITKRRNKALGVPELIAIALGGMIGGGIFTILGISVAMIGILTPLAIILGGVIALLAAYSYIKLGVYYKDEGATYSFFKKTFPDSPFAASLIGWWVIFGYVSTLALYSSPLRPMPLVDLHLPKASGRESWSRVRSSLYLLLSISGV